MKTNAAETMDLNLEITKVSPRKLVGGTWVSGRIDGHRFEALVFPEHAESPDYEIEQSRISKLWIKRIADQREVYNWDRGLDRAPETPVAQAIVEFLGEGLATLIFGNEV